jgi:hypothetical protein
MRSLTEIGATITICFVGGWLLAYMDSRVKFVEYVTDFRHLIPRMIFGGFFLFLVYEVLKSLFEAAH